MLFSCTRLTALCQRPPRWAGTRKVKPIWILLKQETVSGSGISWAIYASLHFAPDKHASTPPLSFLQAGCPSCHTTKSVNALKEKTLLFSLQLIIYARETFVSQKTTWWHLFLQSQLRKSWNPAQLQCKYLRCTHRLCCQEFSVTLTLTDLPRLCWKLRAFVVWLKWQ